MRPRSRSRWGFRAPSHLGRWRWSLTPPFHPAPSKVSERFVFCGTVRGSPRVGVTPPPCSSESGLSSTVLAHRRTTGRLVSHDQGHLPARHSKRRVCPLLMRSCARNRRNDEGKERARSIPRLKGRKVPQGRVRIVSSGVGHHQRVLEPARTGCRPRCEDCPVVVPEVPLGSAKVIIGSMVKVIPGSIHRVVAGLVVVRDHRPEWNVVWTPWPV